MLASLRGQLGPGFESWFTLFVVDATLKGTVILLAAAAAAFLLRRKSATLRHFVWCLAFVALGVLPLLSTALPDWQVPGLHTVLSPLLSVDVAPAPDNAQPPGGASEPLAAAEDSADADATNPDPNESRTGALPSDSATSARVSVSSPPREAASPTPFPWRRAVLRVWLLGATLALVPLAVGLIAQVFLSRRVRKMTDRAWLDPLEDVRRSFKIWRRIDLCVTSRSIGPLTMGILQPVVLVPHEARYWQAERRRVVLLHELAHVSRHDVLTQVFAHVVCALYWFHPLAWYAARRMRSERETACDDRVLNSGIRASAYAQHLLEIACSSRRAAFASAAAVGMPCGSRLESRVTTILDSARNRRPLSRSVILAGTLVSLFAVMAVASASIEPTDETVAAIPPLKALDPRVPDADLGRYGTSDAAEAPAADPGPFLRPLPGFLPSPATEEGSGRWQMINAAPRGSIWATAWSPDGRHVAYAEGGNIRVCNALTLDPERILIGHAQKITAIAWSPNGSQIASASTDGTLRLWDAEGAPGPIFDAGAGAVNALSWSPNSDQIATACADGLVRIWSLDGTAPLLLRGHEAPVNAVAWSPDGRLIASGCDQRLIRLWTAGGEAGPVLEGHAGPVLSISWSPDGRYFASGEHGYEPANEEDHLSSVRIWDATGRPGPVFGGLGGQTTSVGWSPNGRWIAAAGWDGRVRVFSPDGLETRVLTGSSFCIYSIAWSPDSRQLISGSQQHSADMPGRVQLWNLIGSAGRSLVARANAFTCVAWNPDGTEFAASCSDAKVRVWTDKGEPQVTLKAGQNDIWSVAWSPDGSRLASVSRDDQLFMSWNARTWREESRIKYDRRPRDAAWSPDGTRLAVVGDTESVILSDAESRRRIPLHGHLHGVTCVEWSPDGSRFATSSFDSTVRLWSRDGTPGPVLEDNAAPTRAVAWSPDGTRLVSGRQDNNLRMWSADGTAGPLLKGHAGYVQSVAWSPDGKHIASAGWDNTVRLWSADGRLEATLQGHGAAVFSVAWHPDSRRLLSAGHDGVVRLWDTRTAECIYCVVLRSDGATTTLSASGDQLYGDPSVVDSEFVYLVEETAHSFRIVKPAEFRNRTFSSIEH